MSDQPRKSRHSQANDGYLGTPPETWAPEPRDISWGPPFAKDPARAQAYRQQMQKWLDDPWTLDERWRARAKRELNESSDPEKLRQEVNELRKLVAAEKGLRSRMDDHFLLSFLRSKRHEVKPAFTSLLKYYRMRKVNSQYFELFLPSQHSHVYKMGALNILEGYDLLGRIICYFTANFDPQQMSNLELIKMLIHFLDTVVIDPRVQVAGLTILVNLKQQNVAHAKIVTVHFLKLMLQIFQGSFPVRMKLVLLCHGSFLFRATIAVIRPFIPEKFKERIHIMGSDTKKLQSFISLNMIPSDLGGELQNIRSDTMMERILLNEERLREWSVYGFNDDVNLSMDRMPSLQFDVDPGPNPEAIPVKEEELRLRILEEQRRDGAGQSIDTRKSTVTTKSSMASRPSGAGGVGWPGGSRPEMAPCSAASVVIREKSCSSRPGTAPTAVCGSGAGFREVSSSHAPRSSGADGASPTLIPASASQVAPGASSAAASAPAPRAFSANTLRPPSGGEMGGGGVSGVPKAASTGTLGSAHGGGPKDPAPGVPALEPRGRAGGGAPGAAVGPFVSIFRTACRGATGGASGGGALAGTPRLGTLTGTVGRESRGVDGASGAPTLCPTPCVTKGAPQSRFAPKPSPAGATHHRPDGTAGGPRAEPPQPSSASERVGGDARGGVGGTSTCHAPTSRAAGGAGGGVPESERGRKPEEKQDPAKQQ